MTITTNFLFRSLIICLTAASALACSKSNNDNTTPPAADIQLETNATLGTIITDNSGRTLYFFSDDAAGASTCNGGCLDAWPLFYKDSIGLQIGNGLDRADFSTITRSDNKKQTTYKGWPLYYYIADTKPGDIAGEAVGGNWFAAKPDYSVMLAFTQLVGSDGKQYIYEGAQQKEGQGLTPYLTDDHGKTLYQFTKDSANNNNYTVADFSNDALWPMYQLPAIKSVPSSLNKNLFATFSVFGRVQVSYNGWPLYYFGNDNKQRGSTKGITFPKAGVWPIVNGSSTAAPR